MPSPERNRSLEEELKASPRYREVLKDAASEVRKNASLFGRAAHAPWMPPTAQSARGHLNTGRMFVIDEEAGKVFLVNTDYAGHLVEWGSKNNPAHAPMRRGVRAAGLRFAPAPPQ